MSLLDLPKAERNKIVKTRLVTSIVLALLAVGGGAAMVASRDRVEGGGRTALIVIGSLLIALGVLYYGYRILYNWAWLE